MGYLQEADRWIEELLQDFAEGKTFDELKRAIREKILESYRNGQAAGRSPAPRKAAEPAPKRYAGNWQCSQCRAAITSLPFKPKGASPARLLCLDCYNAGRAGE